ncbi:MAG: HlyD family efflux transporter periplasmic adaptor subunit, partial [Parvularculaceae bacterium]
ATQQARSEQMRDIDARLAELEPQFAAASTQVSNTIIRAPGNGAVVGLKVFTEGAVVRAGERMMEIVPEGRELVVEAQVRPEDADNLEIGQPAEIRVTAFKGRKVPILNGSVIRVSADRFTDERSGLGYFVAQIRVPAEELDRAARLGAAVRAGLPADAVIATRKRTALQFLLEPLNQSLWRSFREE